MNQAEGLLVVLSYREAALGGCLVAFEPFGADQLV
jgi:hypothetical protein